MQSSPSLSLSRSPDVHPRLQRVMPANTPMKLRVEPHAGRKDPGLKMGLKYHWCLFDGAKVPPNDRLKPTAGNGLATDWRRREPFAA